MSHDQSDGVPQYTYTPDKRPPAETSEQLRARIPGWGVDLDPADRPQVPRERLDLDLPGVRWRFPERQPEHRPRERSIEHGTLPPVFGTAQPLHGLSGAIRRRAYSRYSEARAAHWLLLVVADRVEARGAALRSFGTLRPDNPVTETGIVAEVTHHGWRSRVGRGRTDVGHHSLDVVLVGGSWAATGAVTYLLARRVSRRARRA
ncbi:hypothetical protein FE634_19675 [Nocardioides dongxiaopingii]|uniref:hypothetical protein n=1 Tax=Nocardioides sp. S-1144 TaxID=2582905 RepID=UPI00110EEC9B|nr:hypothetical protein [Nocardioides sp. S-1144]QCW52078.1 hypothetical protein FE634_19675 [Nocardioides sp. S-1144]